MIDWSISKNPNLSVTVIQSASDDFHLPVERVGVVFKADGYIAEVLIAPFLLNEGMSHSCFISNAV